MNTTVEPEKNCKIPRTFFDYVNEFFFETLEIVLVLYMVYIVQGKQTIFIDLLRTSLMISFIMTLVDVYNESMKNAMKMSIFASLGSKLI